MTRQLKARLICLSIVAIVLTACSGGQRAGINGSPCFGGIEIRK